MLMCFPACSYFTDELIIYNTFQIATTITQLLFIQIPYNIDGKQWNIFIFKTSRHNNSNLYDKNSLQLWQLPEYTL